MKSEDLAGWQIRMDQAASLVFRQLQSSGMRLVLAESCTAGLIASTMARIPGASAVLAGSAVVYQPETKTEWLGIDAELLNSAGIVSQTVAVQMAVRVLEKTPHAGLSLSITGHLGPDAPVELDGVAWCGFASRSGRSASRRLLLYDQSPVAGEKGSSTESETAPGRWLRRRRLRQADAVIQALNFAFEQMNQLADG